MADKTSAALIATALALRDVGGVFGLADPNQEYPLVTFNRVGGSRVNATAPSFGAETEDFPIQISVFDDRQDITRLLSVTSAADMALERLRGTAGVVRVRRIGGTGPDFLEDDRYWRATRDFTLTMGSHPEQAVLDAVLQASAGTAEFWSQLDEVRAMPTDCAAQSEAQFNALINLILTRRP